MNELAAVREEALGKVAEAEDLATLENLRVAYLGKKGALTGVLKSLGKLPPEERPAAGAAVNSAKEEVQAPLEAIREASSESSGGAALDSGVGAISDSTFVGEIDSDVPDAAIAVVDDDAWCEGLLGAYAMFGPHLDAA